MECVVLAAGEGKRMRPLTAKRPKVMLPLANRPMIEHLVLAARNAGITKFVFVVGYGEREIRGHFGTDLPWGFRSPTLRSDNSVGRQMLCDLRTILLPGRLFC